MNSKKQQRLAHLLSAIQGRGMMPLGDAAGLFGVSQMTIRRDVSESNGRLAALGGYVVAEGDRPGTYALDVEQDSHLSAKIASCERALGMIEPEDTIFIDCGTTLPHLARRLPSDQDLTVVCYSMNIAEVLVKASGIRLIMIGGLYHAPSASFSGREGLATLKSLRLNKAFISAGGVHPKFGISCSNFYEVPVKCAAIENAVASYLVVDPSKLDKVKPAYFAQASDFVSIISEAGV